MDDRPGGGQGLRPLRVGSVTTEQSLDIGAVALIHRLQAGDGLASPHDREALAPVFHGVEKVSEALCRFSRGDLGHMNQIRRPHCVASRKIGTLSVPSGMMQQ